jgi:hypothetical protein
MSTVKKGDAFEDEVFAHLKQELENDRLLVLGKNSKIFQKKGYLFP